jgi:hypothetical protein
MQIYLSSYELLVQALTWLRRRPQLLKLLASLALGDLLLDLWLQSAEQLVFWPLVKTPLFAVLTTCAIAYTAQLLRQEQDPVGTPRSLQQALPALVGWSLLVWLVSLSWVGALLPKVGLQDLMHGLTPYAGLSGGAAAPSTLQAASSGAWLHSLRAAAGWSPSPVNTDMLMNSVLAGLGLGLALCVGLFALVGGLLCLGVWLLCNFYLTDCVLGGEAVGLAQAMRLSWRYMQGCLGFLVRLELLTLGLKGALLLAILLVCELMPFGGRLQTFATWSLCQALFVPWEICIKAHLFGHARAIDAVKQARSQAPHCAPAGHV